MPTFRNPPPRGEILDSPNLKYYVRKNKDDTELSSPLTYSDAVDYGRRLSITDDGGLAEVIDLEYNVIAIIRRGKILVANKIAQVISKKGIPPAP